ncbi:MAG: type II toxin-antitoxin system RelE/ParE family toxin [Candidatus Aenigmarchaeota archaeon]|nr:type II toxin-antitoxin system RelE/ParE family toxin [Candidatus Aenigmarchaeota archaeon]
MVEIKLIIPTDKFEEEIKKIKDGSLKEKIKKQLKKIVERPEVGKPLSYDLKGERTIYIKPYRLIYSIEGDKIILLRFEHRKEVYR